MMMTREQRRFDDLTDFKAARKLLNDTRRTWSKDEEANLINAVQPQGSDS